MVELNDDDGGQENPNTVPTFKLTRDSVTFFNFLKKNGLKIQKRAALDTLQKHPPFADDTLFSLFSVRFLFDRVTRV